MQVWWKPPQKLKQKQLENLSCGLRQFVCQLNSGSFCQADPMLDFSVTQSNIYMCVCVSVCVLHCDITVYYYYVIFCDICDHPVGSSNWITLNHLESRWCPKIDTSDWMVRTTNFQVDGDAATWPKDLAELDISWYQMILNDVNRLSLDMGNTYLGHEEDEN